MTVKRIPTETELDKAYDYAMKKLCTEIPSKYGKPGLTRWNEREKVCDITFSGCQESITNPISQPAFTSNGRFRNFSPGHNTFGKFWERSPPEQLAWRVTKNSGGQKVCARANTLLYQWCHFPETRADKHTPGITNVPRFQYNIRNGKEECMITKKYCDEKGVDFVDQQTNKDCKVSTSQKVAEFFSGSVLVRNQKRKRAQSDKRLKKNIKLIKKNFPVPGLNLYTFDWNDNALLTYRLQGSDVGFLADEFDPKYVEVDKFGYKHLKLDVDDETMNKVYAYLKIKDVVKTNLSGN